MAAPLSQEIIKAAALQRPAPEPEPWRASLFDKEPVALEPVGSVKQAAVTAAPPAHNKPSPPEHDPDTD